MSVLLRLVFIVKQSALKEDVFHLRKELCWSDQRQAAWSTGSFSGKDWATAFQDYEWQQPVILTISICSLYMQKCMNLEPLTLNLSISHLLVFSPQKDQLTLAFCTALDLLYTLTKWVALMVKEVLLNHPWTLFYRSKSMLLDWSQGKSLWEHHHFLYSPGLRLWICLRCMHILLFCWRWNSPEACCPKYLMTSLHLIWICTIQGNIHTI